MAVAHLLALRAGIETTSKTFHCYDFQVRLLKNVFRSFLYV